MPLLPRELFFLLYLAHGTWSSITHYYTPPQVPQLSDLLTPVPIGTKFSSFFGASNLHLINDGYGANLALSNISGSGLVSKNAYNHGFFTALIKLPPGFTSGVVVAFYLSNVDSFPRNHDELDIELLGREKTRDWVMQTNIYTNGFVKIGREEKFYLWFDPTKDYHHYSIIWNNNHIVFLIDNIPVRELLRNAETSPTYPSKPMSLYATIWDGSEWATHGGKYPVNYRFSPFVASFGKMEMEGCVVSNGTVAVPTPCLKNGGGSSLDAVDGQQFARLSQQQVAALRWARQKLMFYSYCTDRLRFQVPPPECTSS